MAFDDGTEKAPLSFSEVTATTHVEAS